MCKPQKEKENWMNENFITTKHWKHHTLASSWNNVYINHKIEEGIMLMVNDTANKNGKHPNYQACINHI